MLYITSSQKDCDLIVDVLMEHGATVFPFTDGHKSHLDILMTCNFAGIKAPIDEEQYRKILKQQIEKIDQGNNISAVVKDARLPVMQRGVRNTDLFVSVMSVGAFGFSVFGGGSEISLHGDYVSEKLRGLKDRSHTYEELATLIKRVRDGLRKHDAVKHFRIAERIKKHDDKIRRLNEKE